MSRLTLSSKQIQVRVNGTVYISLHQLTTAVTAGGFSFFVLVNIVVKTDPGKIEWNSLHQLTSANIS